MQTKDFESTALRRAEYDPATKRLTITFNSGTSTTYQDVPADIFAELCKAKSAGSYFHKSIRGAFAGL